MNAKQTFSRVRAPDERAAEERAWEVVRSAYREQPGVAARRSRWRLVMVPALVALVGALALSPAGATVGRLIRQALGVQHAARALFSLPAPGRLLVSGPGGTWIVAADGSSRRIGTWPQASWSPHGLYVAVARTDELAALDPRGVVRWTLARPAVSDPTWFSPSGFRIAYLSARHLRVVAGDGTGDRQLASNVAPVVPAWQPDHPYQLAYEDDHGTLVLRDADSGQVIWTAHAGAVISLGWSADGSRLLALTPNAASVYDRSGRLLARVAAPVGARLVDGALSPDGRKLALVSGEPGQEVSIANLSMPSHPLRSVLSGTGIRQAAWAPDGRWLLISWPAADQWVFVHVAGAPRIAAVSRIAQQFASGQAARAFPTVEGWCCTARATPSH